MSFIPISYGRGQWNTARRVRFYMSPRYRQCMLTFTRSVVEDLGWNKGDRILVSIGENEDFGKFHLVRLRGQGGYKLSTSKNGSDFAVNVTVPEEIGKHSREEFYKQVAKNGLCEFATESGRLTVALPLAAVGRPVLQVLGAGNVDIR